MTSNDPLDCEDWSAWVPVSDRDQLKCVYCGLDGKEDLSRFRQLVLDHLVPKSRGGEYTTDNLVTSCGPCNKAKGIYDPRKNLDGTPNLSASPEQMIENVRTYLRGDWGYHQEARTAFIVRLSGR
jgi:hypothetical protein